MAMGRRSFLLTCGAAGLLPAVRLHAALATVGSPVCAPVCAVENGQPWLDPTGRAAAYRPPAGARGAQVLADLDEAALRHAHCYL